MNLPIVFFSSNMQFDSWKTVVVNKYYDFLFL